ncbi:MAG TPA: MOSC domain-containing protein [Rhizomicrobium sp.]|nr:MOSC domain-containing protein [Rhizomicrobium sp.]
MDLRILSVNIGRARVIGAVHGEPVLSGIDKKAMDGDTAFVGALGINGDEQADLTVHGGIDKAVYAYPSENWPWWTREKGIACGPATFGENLTLEGADENNVSIGDRFRWGDAVLEVSQPRAPCYKLGMYTGRPDAPQLMTLSARCGWYLRVVAEGHVPISAAALTRVSQSGAPSVFETFVALFGRRIGIDAQLRARDTPQLAESWRQALTAKIGRN